MRLLLNCSLKLSTIFLTCLLSFLYFPLFTLVARTTQLWMHSLEVLCMRLLLSLLSFFLVLIKLPFKKKRIIIALVRTSHILMRFIIFSDLMKNQILNRAFKSRICFLCQFFFVTNVFQHKICINCFNGFLRFVFFRFIGSQD